MVEENQTDNITMVILATGEEVVGSITKRTSTDIVVDDALLLFSDLEESGQVIFRKYSLFTQTWDVAFNRDQVLTEFTSDEIVPSILSFYKSTLEKFKTRPFQDPMEDNKDEVDLPTPNTVIH